MLQSLLPSEVHAEASTETVTPASSRKKVDRDRLFRIEDAVGRIETLLLELQNAAAETLPRRIDELLAARSQNNVRQFRELLNASLETSLRKAVAEASTFQRITASPESVEGVEGACERDRLVHQCADGSSKERWSTRRRRSKGVTPVAEARATGGAQVAPHPREEVLTVFEMAPPREVVKDMDVLSSGSGQLQRLEQFSTPKTVWDGLPKTAVFAELQRGATYVGAIEEPQRTGKLADFVEGARFELICTVVIIFNAFFAAYTADYQIKHLHANPTTFITLVERCLLSFYIGELGLRIYVHQLYFLCNSSWGWNLFDFFLVLQSVYETTISLLGETSAGGVMFMRLFRLLKLSKIVRVVKIVRAFRELRMMLHAVRHSVGALLWAIVMLMFFLYVFSLIFVQGFTAYLADNADTLPEDDFSEIMEHFGSVMTTVISLYKAGLGGDDWSTYYAIADRVHWSYGCLFLFYIAFFSFTVTNILTGMIVENVVSMSAHDEENVLLEFRRSQNGALEAAERVFTRIDHDDSGDITLNEFLAHSQSDEVQALMSTIGLDVRDAELFFRMLHECSPGEKVNVKLFVEGCLKIRGTASSIDVQCLSCEVRVIRQMIADLMGDGSALAHRPSLMLPVGHELSSHRNPEKRPSQKK